MPWHTLLVLGGIESGRRTYAEAELTAGVDGEPGARLRRITGGAGLAALADQLRRATPEEYLLVEDLAGWLPAGTEAGAPEGGTDADPEGLTELVAAVRACPARLALVSPEVGLHLPASDADRRRAERIGAVNRAVAAAVDAVVLVVAGQPSWLKGSPGPAAPVTVQAAPSTSADRATVELNDLTGLPVPDEDAGRAALARLPGGGVGLGALAAVVSFVASCRPDARPRPWQRIRVLALHGDHPGAAATGVGDPAAHLDAIRAGTAPLARFAAQVGAGVQIVETPPAGAIETGPAMPSEQVEATLIEGWQLAERAAADGVDLLVLAAVGDGAATSAAALTTMLLPGADPAALLGRVHREDGQLDDAAWMSRAAGVRDALRRVRDTPRGTARLWLAELGGPDLTVATGLLIGAAARRVPVLLSGPLGAAAGLAARNLAPVARRWWLLPDAGGHPLVTRAADNLSLTPVLDLRLNLGEGVNALAALPLLQTALSYAAGD